MKLLIEDDQGNRSVVPVIRDEITIGRKEDNTIRLTERNVSRHHAKLVRQNGTIFVEDVEARYGVKKNGQEIDDRAEFGEGDVVLIGDYRLTLRPEQAKNAQPADGEAVAAEISPELQNEQVDGESFPDQELEEEPDQPIADEPTQVQEADEVEGAPADSKPAAASSDTQIIETEPAELVVVSSNFAGQEFPLDRDEMVVGRGEDCDIIIDHRSVSNKHAKIIREAPEEYKIVDLNSRNGVKVSGEEYKSAHLERGDVVELGHVKFRFVEPGENYVFTPQDQADEPEAPVEAGGSPFGPVALGVGAAIVLVAAVGAFFVFSGSGSDSTAEAETPTDEKDQKTVAVGENDEPSSESSDESSGMSARVDDALEDAEQKIQEGELEEAIGALEQTRELLEPSRDQNQRIDKLLSKARNEQPFRSHYKSAKQALEEDAPQGALESLNKIPSHSVFQSLIEEENLREKAVEAVLADAQKALENEDYDQAETLAKLAAASDVQKKRAEKLLDEISKAREGGKPADEPRVAAKGAGGSGTGGSEPARDPEPAPDPEPEPEPEPEPGVSAAQAQNLADSAKSKVLKGNPDGAVADCTRALRAGHTPCHRVLGMAYKQKGEQSKACRHFDQYLSTSPPDASRIRSLMADMGCK